MSKILLFTVALACAQSALFAQSPTIVSVDPSAKAQTVAGFGAAIGYFDNWVTAHPNKPVIYKLIFSDLNLGILRLRNNFGYPNSSTADPAEIVQQAGLSLGHPIEVLLSSWSPPAALKLHGTTTGGTLLTTNGQFVYADFAQWWFDALQWYAAAGVGPTYISIQNEPDFETTSWDTSVLKPTESPSFAAYGKALTAVYNKLQTMPGRPKIMGPEVTGVGFNNFQNYADTLNRTLLDGYAYHLYNGGDANNPDSFNSNLNPLKVTYNDKPNIMTEFSGGTWFNTAWLIQNCLLNANAAGYLYWDLVWGRPFGTGGLVSLESPWDQANWTTPGGYVINPEYYALKHFSKFIEKGYTRVLSSTVNSAIRPATFLSPDGNKLVAVLINIGAAPQSAAFSLAGFAVSSVTGVQSVENNYYYSLGGLTPSASVALPGLSVTTLEFTKGSGVIIPTSGVSVAPLSASLASSGTILLSATVTPATATNKTVSWSSNNSAVATVDASGVVQGVSPGLAMITVKTQSGGFTATSAITVNSIVVPATGVTVTPATGSLSLGGTMTLVATITPANATNKSITWSSSNTTIATVNSSGLVTGVAVGSATITAATQNGAASGASVIKVLGGGGAPCANPVLVKLPFVQNGAGEFCWVTSGTVTFINSWNTQLLEINGVPFTNAWSNTLPPRINGSYYIHYRANVPWAHFEINGTP